MIEVTKCFGTYTKSLSESNCRPDLCVLVGIGQLGQVSGPADVYKK